MTLSGSNKSRGQMLVLFAFVVTALVALAGMGVDIANASYKRAALQKAVDAGALGGMRQYELGSNIATATTQAQNIVKFNLNKSGIPDNQITMNNAQLAPNAAGSLVMDVTARINSPTFLTRILGLSTAGAAATAQTVRKQIIVALVFDSSESMNSFDIAYQQKLASAKYAGKQFVTNLIRNFDQVSIIAFADNAQVIMPMTAYSGGSLENYYIDSLTGGGNTNIADAVVKARQQIQGASNVSSEAVKAMIILSDGAPNIVSGQFSNINSAPASGSALPSQRYNIINRFVTQPGVPSGTFVWAWLNKIYLPAYGYQGNYTNYSAPCHNSAHTLPNQYYYVYGSTDPSLIYDPQDCLNTYQYADSQGNNRGQNITAARMDISQYPDLMQEAYNLALKEAQYARQAGIIIYTIGYGNVNTPPPACSPTPAATPTCPPGQGIGITAANGCVSYTCLPNAPPPSCPQPTPALQCGVYPMQCYSYTVNGNQCTSCYCVTPPTPTTTPTPGNA